MSTHRDLALEWAEEATDIGAALSGLTHALLAIEDRLDALVYVQGGGSAQPRADLDATDKEHADG